MDMLETMDITVTDEVTLLKERLDEAHAQMSQVKRERDALRVDRDAAITRIGQLAQEVQDVRKLLNMMTSASSRKTRELDQEQAWHDQELQRLAKRGEKREMWSAFGGVLAGFASTAIMVAIVYLIV